MKVQERFTGALVFSLVTGGLVALFWGVWHFAIGPVPVLSEIKITEDYVIALPFDISRWWDVLMTILFTSLAIFILTSKMILDEDHIEGMYIGLIFVVVFLACFALPVGVVYSLAIGFAIGLAVGLTIGLISWPISWLVIGLIFGLIFGPPVGLAYVLAYALIFGLGFCIYLGGRAAVEWWPGAQ